MRGRFFATAALGVGLMVGGCAGQGPVERSTLTGAGVGALGGAALGSFSGNAGWGAVAGAGAGALGGYLLGESRQSDRRAYRRGY